MINSRLYSKYYLTLLDLKRIQTLLKGITIWSFWRIAGSEGLPVLIKGGELLADKMDWICNRIT